MSEKHVDIDLNTDDERDPDQTWYSTPEARASEQQSFEDVAVGKYKDFDSMDEFIEDLFNDEEDHKN